MIKTNNTGKKLLLYLNRTEEFVFLNIGENILIEGEFETYEKKEHNLKTLTRKKYADKKREV